MEQQISRVYLSLAVSPRLFPTCSLSSAIPHTFLNETECMLSFVSLFKYGSTLFGSLINIMRISNKTGRNGKKCDFKEVATCNNVFMLTTHQTISFHLQFASLSTIVPTYINIFICHKTERGTTWKLTFDFTEKRENSLAKHVECSVTLYSTNVHMEFKN